jgi:asparagine synthase (glutamine-hydrolysing)
MCGIAGELRFDGLTPDPAALRRMTDRLSRRGPDAEGFWRQGPAALGHRRLAIIDLSDRSAQPMADAEAGLVLVFNGTIYNYPELRGELLHCGHRFHSDGDTEVILRAYAEWGEGCVERLHGAFAFAIFDTRRQSLFLARDRLGIKPLYYSLDPRRISFASSVQALLAAGDVDTGLDAAALHHHFSLHAVVPAPRTVLAGVRKLAPATWMRVARDGTTREGNYWRLDALRPALPKSDGEWREAIHGTLKEAVRKRLAIADVKVGVLLSGGLDSSLLVAQIGRASCRERVS